MREVFALAVKDLRLLMRDKAGFFFTFFFPLLMAIFFGTIFSGGDDDDALNILLVDEDGSPESHAFAATLEASPELRTRRMAGRAEAADQVRRGESVAYVILKTGFGAARRQVFWGDPPRIEIGVDPARRAEAGLLEGVLIKYSAQALQEVFSNRSALSDQVRDAIAASRDSSGLEPGSRATLGRFLGELDRFLGDSTAETGQGFRGFEPLAIDRAEVTKAKAGPGNAYAVSFPQGVIWGILGSTAAFGISLVTERTRGTLVRLRMAPIHRYQILAGKALACFVTTVGLAAALFALGMLAFGVTSSSPAALALAVVSAAIAFVGIMMFLSVLGRTEQASHGMSWAILLVMSMLGGGMVPLFVMPSWMQSLSHVSPVKWAVLAMEGAVWRGFSWQEMALPCGILLAIGAVFFAIGIRTFRWTEQG